MPSRNTIKTYIANAYYHVYNRGVEKREIFLDEQDCIVFLHYIKLYLSPVEELKTLQTLGMRTQRFIPLNLSQEVNLLSFALMPNHIHLQVKQHTRDGITKFMRRLSTSYVMYFNKKYKRVGVLFQGRYKAVLVESDEHHLHLSRYIHLNSRNINSRNLNANINFIDFSSYPYFLGRKQASWVQPQEILSFFRTAAQKNLKDILSYQSFVEDYTGDSRNILADLVLEED